MLLILELEILLYILRQTSNENTHCSMSIVHQCKITFAYTVIDFPNIATNVYGIIVIPVSHGKLQLLWN